MYSIYFIKRLSAAIPPFEILRFDIRYSAVRFSLFLLSEDHVISVIHCLLTFYGQVKI